MIKKKIYVNGGILVNTRFFTCQGVTCPCNDVPEDAIYIEPPLIKAPDGSQEVLKCLLIDDDHPQSLFSEYYCKTFFTSYYNGVDYLNMLPDDCFREFCEGINDARDLFDHFPGKNDSLEAVFYKMIYLHVISCIDSYICSIILSQISHKEDLFVSFYNKLLSSQKKNKLMKSLINGERGKWEQGVIKGILHLSFCDMDRIKDCFKLLKMPIPRDKDGIITNHFENRHLLTHRNGKQINGGKLIIDKDMAEKCINDMYRFGENIYRAFL